MTFVQSLLSKGLERIVVGSLTEGQSAWVHPDALFVTRDRKVWIRSEMTAHALLGDGATVFIRRVREGVEVEGGTIERTFPVGHHSTIDALPVMIIEKIGVPEVKHPEPERVIVDTKKHTGKVVPGKKAK